MILILIFLILILIIILILLLKHPKIHIYTITNTTDKWEINALEASIKKYNNTLNIIHTKDEIGRLPIGYGSKIMRLFEAIQDRNDKDIICFVDAFDILFIAPISELLSKYQAMNLGDKVLFSAEKSSSCWPTSHQYKDYCKTYEIKNLKPKPGDYGYLNSGMLIGTVKGIKSIILDRWTSVNQQIDDQGFYGQSYLYTDQIVLDTKCELFQNLVGDQFDDLVWDENKKRWYNKYTKSYPVIAQGNGDSRDKLFEVIMPKVLNFKKP
jgi:hypothetical protein